MPLSRAVSYIVVPIAAVLGCGGAPPEDVRDAARADFVREHYCPASRVDARTVDLAPPAPPAIARDAERLALWEAHAKANNRHTVIGRDGAKRQTVRASGCGEAADYACWIEGGWVPGRRSMHYVDVTAVCEER